MILLDNGLLI